MAKISVGDAWDDTKAFLARERRLIVPVVLALVMLPMAAYRIAVPEASDLQALVAGVVPAWASLLMYVLLFVELVALLALVRLALGKSEPLGASLAAAIPRTLVMAVSLLLLALLFGIAATLAMIPFMVGDAAADPSVLPPGLVRFAFVAALLMILMFCRLVLMVPAAAVERGGPITLIKRGWRLGKGNGGRLVGTMALLFIASVIANAAAVTIIGLFAKLVLGSDRGLTVGGLLVALAGGLVSALIVAVQAGLIANLYRQAVAKSG